MSVLIPLKAKYGRKRRPTPKMIKNQSSGNNNPKRRGHGGIDWSKGTGTGRK